MFKKIFSLFNKSSDKKEAFSDHYEGDLVNKVREGKGTMYFKSGDIYKGEWHNGLMHGFGEYTFKSGEKYVGGFINGLFGGQGRFIYTDGKVYGGHFLNGKRDGNGTLTCSDGSRYEGNWINDRPNGMGTIYNADGTVFRGLYNNGNVVDGFTTAKDQSGNWVQVRYVSPELEGVKGCEVVLVSYPYESKVQAIKEVREITGYGLALAKDIAENVPQWVKKGVSLAEAEKIKARLEAIGGIVEIR